MGYVRSRSRRAREPRSRSTCAASAARPRSASGRSTPRTEVPARPIGFPPWPTRAIPTSFATTPSTTGRASRATPRPSVSPGTRRTRSARSSSTSPRRSARQVTKDEAYAEVESVKAVSDVYAPLSGEVTEVNSALAENPEKINQDPYGEGWMVKVKLSDPSEADAADGRGRLQEAARGVGLAVQPRTARAAAVSRHRRRHGEQDASAQRKDRAVPASPRTRSSTVNSPSVPPKVVGNHQRGSSAGAIRVMTPMARAGSARSSARRGGGANHHGGHGQPHDHGPPVSQPGRPRSRDARAPLRRCHSSGRSERLRWRRSPGRRPGQREAARGPTAARAPRRSQPVRPVRSSRPPTRSVQEEGRKECVEAEVRRIADQVAGQQSHRRAADPGGVGGHRWQPTRKSGS